MDIGMRCDFHMHSLLSDGELLPTELARRAAYLGHEAIAITDHVDSSNLDLVVRGLVEAARDVNAEWDLVFLVGVEITHVPLGVIPRLARRAKLLGANLVVVHGETPVEPVLEGTNRAALESEHVDILAHPGLLKGADAKLAAETGKYVEITARPGHNRTNGHVAKVCSEEGAEMLVNTDLHSPSDFVSQRDALLIALGAGLSKDVSIRTIRDNPRRILADAEIHSRR